jgi:hypothetical protein
MVTAGVDDTPVDDRNPAGVERERAPVDASMHHSTPSSSEDSVAA